MGVKWIIFSDPLFYWYFFHSVSSWEKVFLGPSASRHAVITWFGHYDSWLQKSATVPGGLEKRRDKNLICERYVSIYLSISMAQHTEYRIATGDQMNIKGTSYSLVGAELTRRIFKCTASAKLTHSVSSTNDPLRIKCVFPLLTDFYENQIYSLWRL